MMKWQTSVVVIAWICSSFHVTFLYCLSNGLGLLPIMGWTTGERFSCIFDCENYPNDCISERLVKSMADVLALSSFRNAGYQYVVIGDCWMDARRDSKGRLMADLDRFPNGMANLVSYVHSKNLKIGLYIDLGNATCGGYAGSQGHFAQDAQTLFDWKVDMVRVGACGLYDYTLINKGYPEFGKQLSLVGRPIFYSCDWPAILTKKNGGQADYSDVTKTCNQFRIVGDITEMWDSLSQALQYYSGFRYLFQNLSGPGSYSDPGELVIGGFGLSSDMEQFQAAFWAILSAPMLVSVDLRKIKSFSKHLLLNERVISINQDPLGKMGSESLVLNQAHVWTKPILPTGSFAIGIFHTNIFGLPAHVSFQLSSIQISGYPRYNVTEVLSGINYGIYKTWHTLDCEVNPTGALLFEVIALYYD